MVWFIFAVFTALFESLRDITSKRSLRNVDEYAAGWAHRFFATMFLAPVLLLTGIPAIGGGFWTALLVGVSMNIVATVLYMRALKRSDISLSVPIAAFTPLFLLVTSPFMVGEFPAPLGLAGILLIVAGSYVMNLKERHRGHFEPLKALFREEGPRLMLIVALIWGVTSNIDKIGLRNSSPVFWAISVSALSSVALAMLMLHKDGRRSKQVRTNIRALVPIGFFSALMLVFQTTAMSLTLVSYVISIKRTSAAISVAMGHFLFGEKNVGERLIGTLVMISGAILIAFS